MPASLGNAPQDAAAPALKEIFNLARIEHIADEARQVDRRFDAAGFVKAAAHGLAELSLLQRLRHLTIALHAALPPRLDFPGVVDFLHALAPRLNHAFAAMMLSDYVALHGRNDFTVAMRSLKFLTRFGSSEFAVRHFLRDDLNRTIKVMQRWSRDPDPHVRRLASEGSRPRLPWSFRLEALIDDPAPVAGIIENLKADPALYVRKSVANHLNDITKDHPGWVLDRIETWSREDPATIWIVKHALRSLIKQGDSRALTLIGAGARAQVKVLEFSLQPPVLELGQSIELTLKLASDSLAAQRLVVDYAIHYVKQSGKTSAKVFKFKTVNLAAAAQVLLRRTQPIRPFTTRVHYAGRHEVEIMANGKCIATSSFELTMPGA